MHEFQQIVHIFNHPFFTIVGGITTISSLLVLIKVIYAIIKGVVPVWIRLGLGLSNRKIAVFAKEDFTNLRSTLIDSKIFKEQNVIQITNETLAKSEKETIMLINYHEFSDKIDEILRYKKDADALIIYAPHSKGRIDDAVVEKIELFRNVIIVNFRGRLLNDILVTMITTIHEKR